MSPLSLSTQNVDIVDIRQNDVGGSLINDIHKGLHPPEGSSRSLPTMLLYDTKGLKLFEDITYSEDYYLTNAEIDVLNANAKRIVERIPHNACLLELGSGNLRKIEILLREFERVGKNVDYYALDLSLPELQRTFSEISIEKYAHVGFHGLHGTYDDSLAWLGNPENRNRPTVIMSMGSSIGNFSRPDAANFLAQFSRILGPTDMMVIGLDSCKDPDKVYRAYNDSEGITRQFYNNGLAHANTILGSEVFKPHEWDVVTAYDPIDGRHQAFYSPKQDVIIDGAYLPQGETLIFEEAFKYGPQERERLWHDANLVLGTEFGNGSEDYHIHMLSSAAFSFPTAPSEYAAQSIPSLEEWYSLWTSWDVATKSMIPREELLSKPIKLRNSLVFYLGHIPTFLDIHLTRALGCSPTDPKAYQLIFERGIDPDVDDPEKCHSHSEIPEEWPPLADILDYQERVRSRVKSIYQRDDLAQNRTLGEALWLGFEHEAMHLETFLYMLLQSDRTLPPAGVQRPNFEAIFDIAREHAKDNDWFVIPAQTIAVGLQDPETSVPRTSFGWDNEKPERTVTVPAFEAQAQPITNGDYAKFLQANQLRGRPASWALTHSNENYVILSGVSRSSATASEDFMANFAVRTIFGPVPLVLAHDWPVIASYEELEEYAKWKDCRIPTFEEARSIYVHADMLKKMKQTTLPFRPLEPQVNGNDTSKINGVKPRTPDHQPVQPPSRNSLSVFVDLNDCNVGFKHWHPTPVIQNGDRLAGQGDLGGIWEWTSTPLAPHDGYKAMDIYPGYSSDFFDGKHNVVLGGSWATHPRIAGRTTFVNWYQRNYPYAWAGARLVRDI